MTVGETVHVRLELLHEEAPIGLAAGLGVVARLVPRRVLLHPARARVHRDDEPRLQAALAHQRLVRGVGAPGVEEGRLGMREHVLPVVHVEDGVAVGCVRVVAVRGVDADGAVEALLGGGKVAEDVDVAHGDGAGP
jgi:hypothetical protein